MPNHLHWIFTLPDHLEDAVKVIRTFKSYNATQILKILKSSSQYDIEPLQKIFDGKSKLKAEVSSALLDTFYHPYPAKRSLHQCWQSDPELKAVYSESFLHEKLDTFISQVSIQAYRFGII